MSAVAFDTLEVSQNLEAAGFTPGQASGVAQVLAKTMGDSVVTQSYLDLRLAELKADVLKHNAELKAELKADVLKHNAELKGDILAAKTDILKWVFAALMGQAAIIAALVKLL